MRRLVLGTLPLWHPKAAKSEAKTEMTETCRKRWSLLYLFAIIYHICLENTKKNYKLSQKKTTNTQKPTNTHMHRHTFRNNRRQILLRPPPTHRGGGMRSILKSAAVARATGTAY